MKKILKISGAIFSLATVTLFSSCLKDNAHYVNFGNGGTLVELPLVEPNAAGFGGVAQSVAYQSNDSADTLTVAVNVASPKPPTSPVTVTFTTTDTTALHANAPGQYQLLPAANYKVIGGNTVTVQAGQRLAYIKIIVNASAIGTANSGVYALPVTLVSASQPLAQPYKAIYYVINIKNPYDGQYTVHGFVFRDVGGSNDPALGGNFTATGIPLLTLSPTAVSFAPLWSSGTAAGGVSGTTLTVDPTTNKVTVASSGNATLTNNAAYDNRYDPGTKTFYISYKWGAAPNDRAETDTLVYTGSN